MSPYEYADCSFCGGRVVEEMERLLNEPTPSAVRHMTVPVFQFAAG